MFHIDAALRVSEGWARACLQHLQHLTAGAGMTMQRVRWCKMMQASCTVIDGMYWSCKQGARRCHVMDHYPCLSCHWLFWLQVQTKPHYPVLAARPRSYWHTMHTCKVLCCHIITIRTICEISRLRILENHFSSSPLPLPQPVNIFVIISLSSFDSECIVISMIPCVELCMMMASLRTRFLISAVPT